MFYLSGARCRLFTYGSADATAIPKPRDLLPHLYPDWFCTFLLPAYPGCPGKEAIKRVQQQLQLVDQYALTPLLDLRFLTPFSPRQKDCKVDSKRRLATTSGGLCVMCQSRHLFTRELHDPAVSVACARVMAVFHQFNMPIVKQPRWLFDTMNRYSVC